MSDNKTIVKNTFFLYTRMLINMLVALYTSRVVLNVLGVTDFGIYNLVGGVMAMLSFLNNSMSAATQRFINFERASNDLKKINVIFNLSLKNHFLIAFLVLILGETIGLWFLNYKLVIPSERMFAANMVYQFSLLSTFFDILRLPYGAVILAFEKMSFYAFLGIVETVNKILIIIALLTVENIDHLILYALLYFISSFLNNILFYVYCNKYFREFIQLTKVSDKAKNKELLSFSGWTIFGQLSAIGANQGLSMMLNIFYGVIINAAIGIASQINNAVFGFISNFQIAFQPQIVQSFANQQYSRTRELTLNTSRFSFYLMAIISVPILFFTTNLLQLWLGDIIPGNAVSFTQIILFCSLLESLGGPYWMAIAAIGNMRKYNIIITIIEYATLPIAWLLIKNGYSIALVFSTKITISFLMQTVRFVLVNKELQFGSKILLQYFKQITLVFLFVFSAFYFGNNNHPISIWSMFYYMFLIEVIFILYIIILGTTREERKLGYNFLKNKLNF